MVERVKIVSPVDGRIVAERPLADSAQIEAAVRDARSAQREWAQLGIEERGRLCTAMVEAMLAMEAEIVPELALQMGRPVRYGAGELKGFAERARFMIEAAAGALASTTPEPKPGFKRLIKQVPVGIVLVVAPWNYPFLTAVNSVIPALMAGNTVILKHAAQTLLVGERFAMAAERAGLPVGLFASPVLSHEATAALIRSRQVDRVNFTGSVAGGAAIEQAAAGRFLGVGLELGGKDPAYVRADADLSHAIENIVDGAFFNSGQSCCGIERVYVQESVYEAFLEGAVALTRQYVLGDPLDQATTLGPMVRSSAADLVRRQIAAAVAAGATTRLDSTAVARDAVGSAYMAPQILTEVDHTMAVMREESFGPVVGIMKVRDDEQAIGLMNDSAYGLTASIWTRDLVAAEAIGDRIDTGTVFMNRADYLDPALAWTGVKDTGRGVTLSALGYAHLTQAKSYHLRIV